MRFNYTKPALFSDNTEICKLLAGTAGIAEIRISPESRLPKIPVPGFTNVFFSKKKPVLALI
jgi:hypothetical protein